MDEETHDYSEMKNERKQEKERKREKEVGGVKGAKCELDKVQFLMYTKIAIFLNVLQG